MTRTEKIALPIALGLLLLSMVVHFKSGDAADKNWLLLAAGEWLSGKRLYRDVFEVNPPLILWFLAFSVWISRHLTFLQDYNALTLLGIATVALVIAISKHLIARHPAFEESKRRQWFFALLLAFTFVFFTAPMFFFDREHILLVFTFPYIVRYMPALARQKFSLPLRLLIGALAAFGFCIKPHAAVVFAVLQLIYILRERSWAILWSVENIIICVAATLYVGGVLLFMPDYWRIVLPMAAATYAAYSRKANGMFHLILFVVMMGLTFADFRRRYSSPLRREVYYFLGVCLAYLAYALVNNGWAYTYQPLLSIARILCGWVLMEFFWLRRDALAHGRPTKPFTNGIISSSLNLILNTIFFGFCFIAFFFPSGSGECDESCKSARDFYGQFKALHVRSFGVMTVEYYKWSDLSRQTGARWDTRFNALFMLPMFLKQDTEFTERHRWIITYVSEAFAEDLTRFKPEVMFVDTSPEIYSGHPNIDIVGYYSVTPAFKEAWAHYARSGTISTCVTPKDPDAPSVTTDCHYDIYRRITP